jgi:hypothetical protein
MMTTRAWATMRKILTVAEDGKQRVVATIALDSLPMWLATIGTVSEWACIKFSFTHATWRTGVGLRGGDTHNRL